MPSKQTKRTSSQTKRKPSRKKPTKKTATTPKRSRRRGSSKKSKSHTRRDILIALALLMSVLFVAMAYKLVTKETPHQESKKSRVSPPKEQNSNSAKPIHKTTSKKLIIETIDIKSIQKEQPKVAFTKSKPSKLTTKESATKAPKRAKLVIIIDDVSTSKQLSEISSIGLRLTPSIFPPSKEAPLAMQMAKDLKHYMIHLPMQAKNHPSGAMPDTLTISSTKEQMSDRIKALRSWFPSSVYINSHTGSIFTSDYDALKRLYALLREEGFVFVDSRTSSNTKGERVANEYGDFYLHRDIFLDNVQTYSKIRQQLKLAIKQAKEQGYAIAIGHPHNMTLKTLRGSLDILADVDVVYMDELMK